MQHDLLSRCTTYSSCSDHIQVILCVGGPSSNKGFIDYFADVLLALNKKYFDNLCTFMNGLVKEDGFPTDKVGELHKHVLKLTDFPSENPEFFLENLLCL